MSLEKPAENGTMLSVWRRFVRILSSLPQIVSSFYTLLLLYACFVRLLLSMRQRIWLKWCFSLYTSFEICHTGMGGVHARYIRIFCISTSGMCDVRIVEHQLRIELSINWNIFMLYMTCDVYHYLWWISCSIGIMMEHKLLWLRKSNVQ